MEIRSMCRICLVENVLMYVITNKSLQKMYEFKLADVPFVTEDCRPLLVCYFCCTKLKQCCRLQRMCQEAEEWLAQTLSEDYEHKPSVNQENVTLPGGFLISPIENISIIEEFPAECDAIKQEVADVCEEQCEIELKVEPLNEEFESEVPYNSLLDLEAQNSELMSEDEVEIKVETEELTEQEESVSAAERSPDTNISKTSSRESKVLTAKRKNNKPLDFKSSRRVENSASKSVTKFKRSCDVDIIAETLNHENIDRSDSFIVKKRMKTEDIKKHEGVVKKLFKCDICTREFTRKSDLKRHICRKTGEKSYICDICQRSFIQKQSLHYHMTTHTGKTPYQCILCQRSFTNSGSLRHHILTHTGEKPHKCTECQRSFATKPYLNNHIRTHTGEKPHKCDICHRSFRMKSHLINHIRAHTGEKPYKCDVCERCFISSSYLTKHNRTHTGEKPFKCNMCERSFSQSITLKNHISTHTSEK